MFFGLLMGWMLVFLLNTAREDARRQDPSDPPGGGAAYPSTSVKAGSSIVRIRDKIR